MCFRWSFRNNWPIELITDTFEQTFLRWWIRGLFKTYKMRKPWTKCQQNRYSLTLEEQNIGFKLKPVINFHTQKGDDNEELCFIQFDNKKKSHILFKCIQSKFLETQIRIIYLLTVCGVNLENNLRKLTITCKNMMKTDFATRFLHAFFDFSGQERPIFDI